ncbi:Asp-tRNA(Asn)/Glu-tRNA(Gln) amidotransferase subunit GatC [Candidatus Microgenomates bacterium]|nr:Asp-tRNA(Asn)/Glu-tRNA(Gln) amidotransferase subunit GatC [Candidatus Microgenomates bacterium]
MKIDVGHAAKLANLPLSEEEKRKFGKQLSSILDYVNKLGEVDTKDVEPTSQVTGLENVTREDVVTPSLPQEEVLKNAPSTGSGQAKSTHNGFFKVPAILESH